MWSKSITQIEREPTRGPNFRGIALQAAALNVATRTGADPREIEARLESMPGFRWTDGPGDPAVYDSIDELVEEYGRL